MTKKVRLKFDCWHCHRLYEMTHEIDGQPTLIVACPYCEKEGVVDLNPFRPKMTIVLRGDKPATSADNYNFPAVIPTAQPKG